MKILKTVYGLKNALLEWNKEHVPGILDVGFTQSAVHPTLSWYWHNGQLEGALGIHVDDDLITGSEWFIKEVLSKSRKRFVYGKWAEEKFDHSLWT
eukprot:10990717-Heterocapsa_arctica.AAC.1